MASIKCGNCKATHGSVGEVRACHLPATRNVTPPPVSTTPAEEGMYQKDGVIYKVQLAIHGSGRLYAKRLTADGFVFAGGAIRELNSSHRMTLEQAKEYGALYGVCCRCATPLTDEKSIAAGIGPVCAGKF